MEKNTQNYEGIYILNPYILLEEYERTINELKQHIKTIYEYNILGVKKLAYEIKGLRTGFFVTFKYSLTEEELRKIELQAKDDDNIIKFMNIKY